MNLIKKIRNNKKASIAVEFIVIVFALMFLLCFFMDLMRINQQIQRTTYLNTQLARNCAAQGGIQSSAPNGYSGEYMSSGRMENLIRTELDKIGVQNYTVRINGGNLPTGEIDYKQDFTTEITIQYEWEALNMIWVFDIRPGHFTSTRTGVSEWKFDYGNWAGE